MGGVISRKYVDCCDALALILIKVGALGCVVWDIITVSLEFFKENWHLCVLCIAILCLFFKVVQRDICTAIHTCQEYFASAILAQGTPLLSFYMAHVRLIK